MGATRSAALIRQAARALGLVAALAISPSASAFDASVDVGVHAHRLREFSADGATLVREQGVAPRGELRLNHPLTDSVAMRASLGGWATRADYKGHTQGGVSIESRTDTASLTLEASLAWQPADTGLVLEAGMQVERLRRQIRGAGDNSGLDETLVQPRWLLRAGWRAAETTLTAGVLWGPRASLSVRFENQLFDPARTRSGHSAGLMFEVSRRLGRFWRIGSQIDMLKVGSSLSSPLRRGGETVGTLSQPRWRRDQMTVILERSLGS